MTDLWKNESNEWRSKCPFIRSFIPFVRRLRDGLLWQGQPKCIVHRLRCRHLAPPVPYVCSVYVLPFFFLLRTGFLSVSWAAYMHFTCVSLRQLRCGGRERERERAQLRSDLSFLLYFILF